MNQLPAAPCLATPADDEILSLMGGRVALHLTGNQTAGQAFVSTHVFDPGLGVPRHTHTLEDEIIHVLEGRLEITIDGKMSTAGTGATAFLPRGVPHAWKVAGNRPATFLLTVTPSGMEDMFRELAALPAGPPDGSEIDRLCRSYGILFS